MTEREKFGFPSIPPVLVGLPAWYSLLIIDDNGHARAIAKNAETALENDPAFAGAIRLDEFRGQTMVAAPLPWDPNWWGPRPWEDIDDTRAMLWLQDHEILVGSTVVHEIVNAIAKAHAYHSVIDYFGDLGWTSTSPTTSIWDGTSRVGGGNDVSWLTRYLGVPDSPYVRAVGACWAISGVDRIFNPGCKAPVLVLGDKTGIDKSAVFKILGGPFYSNNIVARSARAAKEQIIGVWIMELDDLDALRRPSDWISVLSFVSRSADQFHYNGRRRGQEHKRQCIFAATTERDTWPPELAGVSGWCFVRCGGNIDLDALARDRDQFWAEALARYGAGERGEIDLIKAAPRQGHVSEINDPAAVIKLYLNARCDFGPTCRVEKELLYRDHCFWREAYGLVPITKPVFGKKLKSAFPKLGSYRADKGTFEQQRLQFYRGLRLHL